MLILCFDISSLSLCVCVYYAHVCMSVMVGKGGVIFVYVNTVF